MTARSYTDRLIGSCAVVVVFASGCTDEVNMAKQPRVRTLDPSTVFPDGGSARPLVEGVVATSGRYFTHEPERATPPPPPLTADLLARGRELFNISCVPCHGEAGHGDGMVVRRGYPQPASYHTQRLREIPDDHIFRVITEGLGKMPPYIDQVPDARDRWALVGYIRALQLSQHAGPGDVPPSTLTQLVEDVTTAPSPTDGGRDVAAPEEHP